MAYKIEIKVRQSSDYWFVAMRNSGPGLTRRPRNATEFGTLAEAKAVVQQLVEYTPEQMRKFLDKDADFETSISLTVQSWKNSDTAPFCSLQKLYTFNIQE